MRDKTLKLMEMLNPPLDQIANHLTDQFSEQFEGGLGSLPPEVSEAIDVVKRALKERQASMETRAAEIYEEHLSEEDIDAILSYQNSPSGKKLSSASNAIKDAFTAAANAWLTDSLNASRDELHKLLGFPSDAEINSETSLVPDLPTA